jgi:Ni,Fe-hydrogenase III large subunit
MSRVQDNAAKTFLADLVGDGGQLARSGNWPRARVATKGWSKAIRRLASGQWRMLGLWGEFQTIHLAVIDERSNALGIISLDCPEGHYPSVSKLHSPAGRLERAAKDLFGLEARGATDTRPWLDHGRWGITFPLGKTAEGSADRAPYDFLPSEGPGLHQIAVGPVHAGVIEPGHFRFTAQGEIIVRLEERLGYTHKGVEGLMAGASLETSARLAGRVSGDSTIAYSWAFAQAAESALGVEPPPRSIWLRALMAEMERLANHLGDIGAVCNDAAFALMHAHCGALREEVLRASAAAFGHRLMRDRIVPGGVTADLSEDGELAVRRMTSHVSRRFPRLVELYDSTASLQDRTVGAGRLAPELASHYGAGGYVGRASGRSFDARRLPGYAPYNRLEFDVPVLNDGDVNARVWIRIREVEQSLGLIEQSLSNLPQGPIRAGLEPPASAAQGVALVEGFRGDIFVWLRLEADGTVGRCHLRDPSWFQWPLLEAAIANDIVADFPLCNKSFNCSYSGHDL